MSKKVKVIFFLLVCCILIGGLSKSVNAQEVSSEYKLVEI